MRAQSRDDQVERLARRLVLGALLAELQRRFGGYDYVAHWTQGEFHHDVLLRLPEAADSALLRCVLVISSNCNGGTKEVLAFAEVLRPPRALAPPLSDIGEFRRHAGDDPGPLDYRTLV